MDGDQAHRLGARSASPLARGLATASPHPWGFLAHPRAREPCRSAARSAGLPPGWLLLPPVGGLEYPHRAGRYLGDRLAQTLAALAAVARLDADASASGQRHTKSVVAQQGATTGAAGRWDPPALS